MGTATGTRRQYERPPVGGIRYFRLGESMDYDVMKDEVRDMTKMLKGEYEAPIDRGPLTLMEMAEAFYARGKEMEMELLESEALGHIARGSQIYKFRTGMLRSFLEMCGKSIELGSRRVTYEKWLQDQIGPQ